MMISRRTVLTAAALGGAAAWGGSQLRPRSGAYEPVVRSSRALGTTVSILIHGTPLSDAESAVAAAYAELDRIEQTLSIYRPDSQLRRLNDAGALDAADGRLLAVLHASLAVARRSGGAFDPSVQPLWELHATGAPGAGEVEAARRLVDWRRIAVDGPNVRLDRGMRLTFNGIAQGYATDRVRDVLRACGIGQALVDIGELGPIGRRSPGTPWTAGIQHPRDPDAYVAVAALDGRCLATSGDYATTFGDGRHHIFDPATGGSPAELVSVSIVAPTAMEADGLSTAVFVMGVERGMGLVEASAGVDALLVRKDGSAVSTKGFPRARA